MLTSVGQAAMSQDDYAYVVDHCTALLSGEKSISLSMNDANTVATVTSTAPQEQGGGTFTWNLVYQDGHWKHQPSDGAMAWMSLPRSKAMSYLKSGGAC